MSHAGSWRAACRIRLSSLSFQFGDHENARSVTDPGVGSGALLDGSSVRLAAIKVRTGSGEADVDEQHLVQLTIQVVDSSQAKLSEPRTPLRTFACPR
jgi:hypothetical protein